MDTITAKANIGKLVYRTDGTPRPPKHHTKKVRAWEQENYSGKLTEVNEDYMGDGRTYISIEEKIITGASGIQVAVFNRSGWLGDDLHIGEHPDNPADESVK